MTVTNDIKYVGVDDREIDLFEGQYVVKNGMSYNSYAIIDDKIAVMDSVDARFGDEWIKNIDAATDGRTPDYLVVLHMEPDHSANITTFMEAYPEAKIVSSAKAFAMMKGFFGTDFADRKIEVKSGDVLSLGKHSLTFVGAPMVHWPEVMVAYEATDKVLFSADGFGKFGALDTDEPWDDEAARYYIGIVGKYGAQVQSLLRAASNLDIEKICALHGPVLDGDIARYLELYDIWSSYRHEKDGVVIAYTSIYGHTKAAALELEKLLSERGADVKIYDLARCDMSAAVADAFRYSKLVLATTTYNGDIFPFMREFIDHLTERNYQGRTVAMIENGSWAPLACKVMTSMLEKSKNIVYAEAKVSIRSALNEQNKAELVAMADELCK